MTKTVFQGKLSHRLRSAWVLLSTSARVLARRALGRPLVPEWSIPFEVGTLFYRRQFNHAFSLNNVAEARAYFDSCITLPGPPPPVDIRPAEGDEPRGEWFTPHGYKGALTILYFHGGGYALHAAVTRNFIAMLSHKLQVRIFSLDYRLTPEHPHPAQLDDALSEYRSLLAKGLDPAQLVICGDSAGGHLVLMTLASLSGCDLPQPLLAIAISPWTHIGRLGASQFGNDQYDMVQGYQTLQYGQWLKGKLAYEDEELSPMGRSYVGTAPIYIQAGDKEILVDMIRTFSKRAANQGARVRLDVWAHMTHEFHAYGDTERESQEAIDRMRQAMDWALAQCRPAVRNLQADHQVSALKSRESAATQSSLFPPTDQTEVDTLLSEQPRDASPLQRTNDVSI
ncbi:alpha/beta hydrolase [Stenotrophomonas pavanii]|uniref:alpha/beta hydrolase n=1 Tax=Stenotrophomonas pavanii TaxID=487698 RepID=UPI00088E3799|nr:alpha/beta hydrolase [Stenotrophomonas pavanii]SDK70913.1 Acetyl esterase/lipase [Stenotrophomonas pavanii]